MRSPGIPGAGTRGGEVRPPEPRAHPARRAGFRAHLQAARQEAPPPPGGAPHLGAPTGPAAGSPDGDALHPRRRGAVATPSAHGAGVLAGGARLAGCAPGPAGPAPAGPAPADAAAHAAAARAAVAWVARCAVAAAAAPGVLRLHLDDRRLGRVGLQVRVRRGRVAVRFAAAPAVRACLLAEEAALAASLARRGLVLDAFRGG